MQTNCDVKRQWYILCQTIPRKDWEQAKETTGAHDQLQVFQFSFRARFDAIAFVIFTAIVQLL